jgi:hypothetical protein
MVGGPVFGPQPRLKRAAVFVAALAIVLLLLWGVFGCSTHSYLYRPVPASMIPKKPNLESIKSTEIPRCKAAQNPCITDETYVKFVKNNDALKQQIDELRALLEASK